MKGVETESLEVSSHIKEKKGVEMSRKERTK